ncbi:MAG: hypothetical protein H6742_01775 [Alphaproteobacteria bacterium]|nr:hypothetical protein [Alphaproteobacteria bacterium]
MSPPPPPPPGGRLRGLARRVRDRVAGAGRDSGAGFDASQDMAFAVLQEEGDSAWQRVGASLVSAWEIGLTDTSRALAGRIPDDDRRRLVERISDALVPTQQPLNDAKAAFSRAVTDGTREGLAAGRLDVATAPLAAVMAGVGADLAGGWEKTTGYLAPVFEVLPDPEAARAAFREVGPALQQLFDEQGATFARALAALPEGDDLEHDLREAVDAWYAATSRGVEVTVYRGRTVLVDAARALPAG